MSQKLYCTHVACRVDTLAELVYIWDRIKARPMTTVEIRERFVSMGHASVPCRVRPWTSPHSAVSAPLAP